MHEQIVRFMDALRKQLDGMPEKDVAEAIGYYEEYLNDASEAGKDLDALLQQLGGPEKIASVIRAEASITKAQRSPGLRNFANAMRYAFHGVTTPFAFLFVSLFILLSYGLVLLFFAGALVFVTGAAGAVFMIAYEVSSIPSHFVLEIVGTAGLGIVTAGAMLLVSFGLYRLGRVFIILSARIMRWFQKNPAPQIKESSRGKSTRKKGAGRLALVLAIASVTGLILFFLSGLPLTYFTIFNSMKPENLQVKSMDYAPQSINKISITTAHSHIVLKHSASDKITVAYEQPDWLDYECSINGSMLSFYEKSNGRLALFRLIRIHESLTEVTVTLPETYNPDIIQLESTGGHILIEGVTGNLTAKTYTGAIQLENQGAVSVYNIKASSESGLLEVGGKPSGQRSSRGTEYYNSVKSDKTIELTSSRGNISIQ